MQGLKADKDQRQPILYSRRSMFKKPLSQIKSFSPLRSSDRRRFQNDAYNAYPSLKDKCSQEGASPLMPDPLLSAKFTTSNNVNGVVHVANNKPLWLKLEGFPPIPTGITCLCDRVNL